MTRKKRIENYLADRLAPIFLEVYNESAHHHVPQGSETHFKITVVSDNFQDMPRIRRHRLLNSLLIQELQTGMHALTLHLLTPKEWQEQFQKSPDSPTCRGGFDSNYIVE